MTPAPAPRVDHAAWRPAKHETAVIHSERGEGYSSAAAQVSFARLYGGLGF